jgi:small subunit ribosomal protein S14
MTREELKKPLLHKPEKLSRFMRFNMPKKRKFGKSLHPCSKCGKTRGVIRQYGLQYCRQCFREEAEKLGFKKYN